MEKESCANCNYCEENEEGYECIVFGYIDDFVQLNDWCDMWEGINDK